MYAALQSHDVSVATTRHRTSRDYRKARPLPTRLSGRTRVEVADSVHALRYPQAEGAVTSASSSGIH
jgi:hypothetical protein